MGEKKRHDIVGLFDKFNPRIGGRLFVSQKLETYQQNTKKRIQEN
jgi:hypothetical protein